MTDLQLSMKYVGPIARTTGQSLEAMTAAIEIMGDAGIKGEQAGTTLRGGLIRLVKPTKQVQQGLGDLHLSAKDLQGPDGLLPLGQIIQKLSSHSEGLTKAQRNQALASVFGTESLSGMLALIQEGAPKFDRLTKANERSDGASKKAADTMNDNVKGAFENLKGSIETVETTLYSKFQEPLKRALLDATKTVNTDGKKVEAFFDRVFEMPEFQAADLGGKLKILLDEFDKTGLPDEIGDKIVQGFTAGLDAAIPIVAKAAGGLGLAAARGFFSAFRDADPLTKVMLALFAAQKTGALAGIRAYGKRAGAEMSAGMSTTASAGIGESMKKGLGGTGRPVPRDRQGRPRSGAVRRCRGRGLQYRSQWLSAARACAVDRVVRHLARPQRRGRLVRREGEAELDQWLRRNRQAEELLPALGRPDL